LVNSPRILEADGPVAVAAAGADAGHRNPPVDVPAIPPERAEPTLLGSPWRSHINVITRNRISGWVRGGANPDQPTALQILDNGVVIARVLANRYRKDLEREGIGSGRHGFELRIPGGLSPLARHVIQVRREADGMDLHGSPVVIEHATALDAGLEQAVAQAVTALVRKDERERALSFLVAQADRVLQQHGEADGQREARLAHRQFRRRWGMSPPAAEADAPEAPDVVVEDPGRRVLVVDNIVPVADRDAASQALLSHMRAFQRLGYAVTFVAANDMNTQKAAVASLEAADIACCRAPFYNSVEDVLRRQTDCFDVVYLHRASNAARYLALARHYCPKARILYSVADLHHLRLERQAKIEDRPELRAHSRRMRLMECTAAWSADAVLTHSTAEAAWLRQAVPEAVVHVVPWALPPRPVATPLAERRGLAFIGGYAHSPNVDAARWLADEIMPLVWRVDPGIECLLVGSGMPQAIARLARPGLVPLGHVAELADIFNRVRLTVAPLRYGAGVKGKVLTSLAAGIPCVMSPVAAEGMDLPTALTAAIGDTAADIAAHIVRLHTDDAAAQDVAASGLAMIRERFNEAHVAAALYPAIEQCFQPPRQDVPPMAYGAAG
jgi:glycosyltransferase involved in cell wall biosynthesis